MSDENDGKPIAPKPTRAPTFTWKGHEFKLRRFEPRKVRSLPPAAASGALIYMLQDYMQVAYLGMTALAKDIYSRSPEGSREFEEFAKSIGLQVVSADGTVLPVADELENL